jgi:hypothetical protein
MKQIIAIILFATGIASWAQEKPLEASALMLENIKYPFPVKDISLNIQG